MIAVDGRPAVVAGRYVLERILGRGGMAMVHAGRDLRLDRRVAIKVVPAAVTEPVARSRFVREARAAAGLCHPNAVTVFDAGEADGLLFIVMELVDGRPLSDVLAETGPLETEQATAIAVAVLAALSGAHAAGIVHRDVKPSNIMVSYEGTVKLLDFGIARRLDQLAGDVTAAGGFVGTPKYLAPEQLDGRPTGSATDVYAVGLVLYEMLAGVAPFDGDDPVAAAFAHAVGPVPDVRGVRPEVPVALARVIRTAMAKDPAARFADAARMRSALAAVALDATAVPGTSTLEQTQVLPRSGYRDRRSPWWLVGAAGLALACLVGWNAAAGLFSFITSGDAPEPRSASALPTSLSVAVSTTAMPTTTVPTTISGVIATVQANPEAYGRQRTGAIVEELVMIEQGDAVSERAANLLDAVAAWVDGAEVTPATLALLEPVLTPLIAPPPDPGAGGDGGGGNGHGHGHGNGNGNGNGNGHGNGHNKSG